MSNVRAGITVLVLLVVATTVGAQDARVEHWYFYRVMNTLSSALNQPISYPTASLVNLNTNAFWVDAGEPSPACMPPGATLAKSGWTLIAFPGGTLSINTGASGYDTVIQIYEYATQYANLRHLAGACAATGPNGAAQAHLVTDVAPGFYLVQIAEEVPPGSLPIVDSVLQVFFETLSKQQRPRADSQFDPQPLALGVAYRQANVEHATRDNADPNPSCDSDSFYRSTLWYRFDVPVSGTYRFALYKFTTSFVDVGGSPKVTIAAFDSENIELRCVRHDVTAPHEMTGMSLVGGTSVFFLVMPEQDYKPISRTAFKVKVTAERAVFLFDIGGFEDMQLDGTPWKAKGLDQGDGIVCGAGAPTPCVFVFGGTPGQTLKLKGKFVLPQGFAGVKGDIVTFGMSFSATENVRPELVKLTLQLKYSDGTPPTKTTLVAPHFNAFAWLPLQLSATLASGKVAAVSVTVQNKNPDGFLYADLPILYYSGEVARGRGALPMPPPLN